MNAIAALLLLAGVLRHLSYEHFAAAALVWNLCGAVVIAILLVLVWRKERRDLALTLVVLWFLYEESLVAFCSAWRIADWWPVLPGEDQCNARLGFKLSALSLVLLGALIVKVACNERAKP